MLCLMRLVLHCVSQAAELEGLLAGVRADVKPLSML